MLRFLLLVSVSSFQGDLPFGLMYLEGVLGGYKVGSFLRDGFSGHLAGIP